MGRVPCIRRVLHVVVVVLLFLFTDLQSHVVLTGQVKQYFACESQHQHGAFDKTGGLNYFLFSP